LLGGDELQILKCSLLREAERGKEVEWGRRRRPGRYGSVEWQFAPALGWIRSLRWTKTKCSSPQYWAQFHHFMGLCIHSSTLPYYGPMALIMGVILFAVTEFLATGSQIPLLFVIDAI
jgi:hypothetical protein